LRLSGKRKALEKKAAASSNLSSDAPTSPPSLPCEIASQQGEIIVTAHLAVSPHHYDARKVLIPDKSFRKGATLIFPLSPDHLITLLQFNALRASALNWSLISGLYTTVVDCDEDNDTLQVLPYPGHSEKIPPSLLPTKLQQTVPHAAWIDLIPSPQGRDLLITAQGSFDEDELWRDCIGGLYEGFPDDEICRRGIIAWNPPWDIAGWEVSEGFLSKWPWLVRGIPGLLEATNRWRRERREEALMMES
jgi:hypothetical protein